MTIVSLNTFHKTFTKKRGLNYFTLNIAPVNSIDANFSFGSLQNSFLCLDAQQYVYIESDSNVLLSGRYEINVFLLLQNPLFI